MKLFLRDQKRSGKNIGNFWPSLLWQGCSSIKIVAWGGKVYKKCRHRGWPTEKIFGFEWVKTTQMTEIFAFFWYIFKYVQNFFCLLKQFSRILFFLEGYFFTKIQKFSLKIKFEMKPCISLINFYIKPFSGSIDTVVIRLWKSI